MVIGYYSDMGMVVISYCYILKVSSMGFISQI